MARPRIPTQLKVLKGTAQRSRMNLQELKPDTGVPEMPDGLDEEHQKSWAQHAKLLTDMKVLAVADGLALESMVRAHVELRRLQAEVAQLPAFERTDSGLLNRHPGITAIADYDKRYLSWLTRFGLTPADRSRVSASTDGNEKNPWAAADRYAIGVGVGMILLDQMERSGEKKQQVTDPDLLRETQRSVARSVLSVLPEYDKLASEIDEG